jgi:hypothetical protein
VHIRSLALQYAMQGHDAVSTTVIGCRTAAEVDEVCDSALVHIPDEIWAEFHAVRYSQCQCTTLCPTHPLPSTPSAQHTLCPAHPLPSTPCPFHTLLSTHETLLTHFTNSCPRKLAQTFDAEVHGLPREAHWFYDHKPL